MTTPSVLDALREVSASFFLSASALSLSSLSLSLSSPPAGFSPGKAVLNLPFRRMASGYVVPEALTSSAMFRSRLASDRCGSSSAWRASCRCVQQHRLLQSSGRSAIERAAGGQGLVVEVRGCDVFVVDSFGGEEQPRRHRPGSLATLQREF